MCKYQERFMKNILENLKHTDKNLLIIIGFQLVILIIALSNTYSLEQKEYLKEYKNISEFLDNVSIFEGYLNTKCDLYWELNARAYSDSVDEDTKKKYINIELFQMRKGPWGWDNMRLMDRYNFNDVMEVFVIKDFSYWSSKGMQNLIKRFPDTPEEFYDMSCRLDNLINDKNYIDSFFGRLLENKISFLKTILRKYEINLDDKYFDSMPDSLYLYSGDFASSFVRFFNDSCRSDFECSSDYHMNFKLQKVFDMHNWICEKVYNEYVKDKFIIYDQAIFENKLPYSSYLDKIKQDKFILEKRIDKKADLPLSLEYQSLQLRMETIAFYKLFLVFLLIFNFIFYKTYLYRTKLRVLFFKESDKEDKRLEIPSILNIVFLNNKERTITFWIIVLQIIISGIVLWINFSYLNIIYNSIMFFLLWCILPFSLIIVLWIKQVNKCNKLISGSSLNQYP